VVICLHIIQVNLHIVTGQDHKHNHHHDKQQHVHHSDHSHHHHHHGSKIGIFIYKFPIEFLNEISHKLKKELTSRLKHYTKEEQAYYGAFIISTAPLPIFLLIIIFRVRNVGFLDLMTSFAAGGLIGDVFLHNIPEIFHLNAPEISTNPMINQLFSKEILICYGILVMFMIEKIIYMFSDEDESNKSKRVVIAFIGDFLHNITDGLAIGAAFAIGKLIY